MLSVYYDTAASLFWQPLADRYALYRVVSLRANFTQKSCAAYSMSPVPLPVGTKDALDTAKISHEDSCPRCGGKLAFRNTTESPTTGSLVDFFRCQDCGHVRSVVRRSA